MPVTGSWMFSMPDIPYVCYSYYNGGLYCLVSLYNPLGYEMLVFCVIVF
jgi:hypothetical protein